MLVWTSQLRELHEEQKSILTEIKLYFDINGKFNISDGSENKIKL